MAEEKTILVVDDTEANIDVLVEILADHYDVSVAMDGASALEIVEEDQPHLVLLDIMMPDMDGYEVLKRIKAGDLTKHIPVVFVSAKSEIDDKLDGIEMGASAYIAKPIDPDEVLNTVARVLAGK
jgi:putative two-component system response regulator